MMHQYRSNSYLFGGNAPYVEELYEAYLDNPGSVPDNWRTYFDNLQHVPAVDGLLREAAGLEEPGAPEPFIDPQRAALPSGAAGAVLFIVVAVPARRLVLAGCHGVIIRPLYFAFRSRRHPTPWIVLFSTDWPPRPKT